MSATGLAKASILKLDRSGKSVVQTIPVMFNPKDLAFAKQNSWKPASNPKTNIPDLEFGGGSAATLKMQLFFDTYCERKDVRKEYTDVIYELMLVDETLIDQKNKKGRPPTVRFQWGKTVGFDAVITDISQRFTLFLPDDGTPVRAVLDVTFQQVKDALFYPPQNPTSSGVRSQRVWTVKEGDTLAWIAYVEYNDPNRWRVIADANGLTQVRRLIPGMRLEIPHA